MNLFPGDNVPNRCFLRIPQPVFCFSCPTCFEVCCWHQIQNKYVFTNTMTRLHILFVLFSIEISQIITYHFYSQHPSFFGIRVVLPKQISWSHGAAACWGSHCSPVIGVYTGTSGCVLGCLGLNVVTCCEDYYTVICLGGTGPRA